jgi:hypothetical protein
MRMVQFSKLRRLNSDQDIIDIAGGRDRRWQRSNLGYHFSHRDDLLLISFTEDQQRINTFSKLNTRVRSLAEKMGNLKVSSDNLVVSSAFLYFKLSARERGFRRSRDGTRTCRRGPARPVRSSSRCCCMLSNLYIATRLARPSFTSHIPAR